MLICNQVLHVNRMNLFILTIYCIIAIGRSSDVAANNDEHSPFHDPKKIAKLKQFYCFKMVKCNREAAEVCAIEQIERYPVRFEDICTLYKINCRGQGIFFPAKKSLCSLTKEYFDFFHLENASTTKGTLKSSEDNNYYRPDSDKIHTVSKTLITLIKAMFN